MSGSAQKRIRDSRNLRPIASTHISRLLNKKSEGGNEAFYMQSRCGLSGAREPYRQKSSKQSLSGIEDRRPSRFPTSISICSASWRGSADDSLQSDKMRHKRCVEALLRKFQKLPRLEAPEYIKAAYYCL